MRSPPLGERNHLFCVLASVVLHLSARGDKRSTTARGSGPSWIRTNVAITQRVYSPSPLATRVSTRFYDSNPFSLTYEARPTRSTTYADVRRGVRGGPARGAQRGRPGESRAD